MMIFSLSSGAVAVFPIAPASAPAANMTDVSDIREIIAIGLCAASHASEGSVLSAVGAMIDDSFSTERLPLADNSLQLSNLQQSSLRDSHFVTSRNVSHLFGSVEAAGDALPRWVAPL